MTRLNFDKTYWCPRCDRQVRILHEHSSRLIEVGPAPSTLPPGWSKTAVTPEDIERLRKEQAQ